MKSGCIIHAALMGVLLAAPIAALAQFMPGQSFSGSAALAGIDGVLAVSNAPDSSLYADGTRAINDDRWSDAVTIFAKVASEKGAHADGALYWKAYAENKQGQSKAALSTCSELRRDFPASSWIHECGALEIEIRAKSGQPVQPMAEQDQNLQLLAVNSLMRRDEPRALAEIQRIMQDDPSERFKEKIL
ncbi:MAG: hypothetical protein ABR991_06290, partial [Terracidiphilus sp.]